MASFSFALQVNGSVLKPNRFAHSFDEFKTALASTVYKPFLNGLQRLPLKVDVSKTIKNTTGRMLDAFVDSFYEFVDQPVLPSQSNFAPVGEIGEAVEVTSIHGEIPADFPEGVYVRNGSNPKFGGLQSAVSVFGRTDHVWVEGEGMLHALYFRKNESGTWSSSYKNKFVESDSFKLERERNKPRFLPTVLGHPSAILAAIFFNEWRFGMPTKNYQNVNAFEHAGSVYTTTENYLPQEFDILTLESLDSWDVNGDWNGPFASHPKKAPGSGELVIIGVDGKRPYYVVGVISADGKKLLNKVDLQFERSVLIHDVGVTQNYNVIIDHPLILDVKRLINGGPLLKYCKEEKARIGVMPRYGDANSVKWFTVEPYCTWHIINTFEDGNEVVVRGCRAPTSIIPGPGWPQDTYQWFSRGFKFTDNSEDGTNYDSVENGYLLHRVHEWRLSMETGQVKERYLTGLDVSMDFPSIHGDFTGLKHKFAFTQVIDSVASSIAGITKYSALAKLHFDFERCSSAPLMERECDQLIKTEYHKFPENVFCTGSTFVPKHGGAEEDDGWIITFVHNEESNVSQAYIIDAKNFEGEPIATITLAHRVPYGNHGIFVPVPRQA